MASGDEIHMPKWLAEEDRKRSVGMSTSQRMRHNPMGQTMPKIHAQVQSVLAER